MPGAGVRVILLLTHGTQRNSKPMTDIYSAQSAQLADAAERIAPFLVRVDDGTRLSATGVSLGGGYFASASHAVESDDAVIVTPDGVRHGATLAGRDEATDIALLKIAADTPVAPLFAGTPRVGELALAVARPKCYNTWRRGWRTSRSG